MNIDSKPKKEKQIYKYCISTFQEKHTFDNRHEQSNCIRSKCPDKLPVIVEKMKNIKSIVPDISKNKFLVPDDLIISQFMCIIRKYLNLTTSESIYLFANDTLLNTSDSLYNVYGTHKDEDGFLYIYYTLENTFG